jgi:hypothetical protein
MAEYSRLVQGQFKALTTGAGFGITLPFLPDYVDIINTSRIAAGTGVYEMQWERDMGPGAGVVNTANVLSYVTSATGTGITPIYAGLGQQMGPNILLGASGSITQSATAPLVTTTAVHGLSVGNVVVFNNLYQTATTGMQQMAGVQFNVLTVPSTTTFTVGWNNNGANYAAIVAGGYQSVAGLYIAGFKKVLYPALYAPDDAVISFVAVAADGINTQITTASSANVQVGQEVAFRIPTVWGPVQLNALPNVVIPGSPIYYYVTSVIDKDNFVIKVPFASLTAFNPNQSFASFPGLRYAQVAPAGDINSGGFPFTATSQLYPSPTVFNGFQQSITVPVQTINGPGIQGAYINATFMGFYVGTAMAPTAADTLYWQAYMMDLNT